MSAGLDFGPIRDDDELLDRLGERQPFAGVAEEDSVAELLAAWTARIDADERAHADQVGPLGLRRTGDREGEPAPRLKVVQLRRGRVVAVAGALALTVSGGGVAAALGNGAGFVPAAFVQFADLAGVKASDSQTPSALSTTALPQAVATLREAVAARDYARAKGILDVLHLLPGDPASPQITQQVEELAKQVDAEAPTAGVLPPVAKAPTSTTADATPTLATAPTQASTTDPATPSAPSTTTAPSATASPDKTVDKTPTPSKAPVTPEAPAPVPSAPTNVGHVGGGQTGGKGPETTPALEPGEATGSASEAPAADAVSPDEGEGAEAPAGGASLGGQSGAPEGGGLDATSPTGTDPALDTVD